MTQIDTIYFIHHSHTDIGYTHDQPIVWELHNRFIDQAIEVAEEWFAAPDDAAFRWTMESTAVLWHWLQKRPSAQIDRLIALEKAGRIEVTAMLANLTPLCDTNQLAETLQLVGQLRRDYGFTIRHAMNCDVNGHNWPLADLLLDSGIEAFSMAVNPHYGGYPFPRPSAFWWQAPSGRKLLTWNGWLYITGTRFGLGEPTFEQFEQVWWPRVQQHLANINYPYRSLRIQSAHPFGDNGSAFGGFSDFIQRWNAAGKTPRIQFVTPTGWWNAMRADPAFDTIPTERGDWTDYWNFGSISSAREVTINRRSRTRLRTADALAVYNTQPTEYRDAAYHHLHFFDEHTWGADQAIHQPHLDDVAAQWHHKAHNAYQARSLSLMLQRDGLAALAAQVKEGKAGDFLLYNPLPWARTVGGDLSPGILSLRNLAWDDTASVHYQDRMTDLDSLSLLAAERGDQLNINARLRGITLLKPTAVPAFGYRVVSPNDFVELVDYLEQTDETTVENEHHRLTFDMNRGGIAAWEDKQRGVQWVEKTAAFPLGGFVHETVSDQAHAHARTLHYGEVWDAEQVDFPDGWQPDWAARRRGTTAVLEHTVFKTPVGITVVQFLETADLPAPIRQVTFLPSYADWIECSASWEMGLSGYPEATYLLFPLALPNATNRLDLGGQAITACIDQLPNVCRDYFTVQGWVDFNNGQRGMTIATPDNPLVQLGDFTFGKRQTKLDLQAATLLGWVTNNYWGTNFRAHQPGRVTARYRLRPYSGPFSEQGAHRFGQEAMQDKLLLHQFGAPRRTESTLPTSGTLLRLPEDVDPKTAVLTLHVKPAHDGKGVIVRLQNGVDGVETAVIQSALFPIQTAQRLTLLEEPLAPLPVQNGIVSLQLAPRELCTLLLNFEKV